MISVALQTQFSLEVFFVVFFWLALTVSHVSKMLPHPSFFFWTLCGQEWKLAGILSINLMDKGATHCKAMWLQNRRTDCCMKPVLLKSKNKNKKITESSSLIGACIALLNPFSLHQLPCPWVISSQPVWVVHKRFAFVNFCEQTLPAPKQTLTTPDFFFFFFFFTIFPNNGMSMKQ